MVKIERLSIELAVLLMISLVAFGGFMSLGISDDGSDSSISDADDGNELTGDWKKPKLIKKVQREVARAVKRESPKPVVPIQPPKCNPAYLKRPSVCPQMCRQMWQLKNNACTYNSCGSGCGVDCISTFSSETQCREKINKQIIPLPVLPPPTPKLPINIIPSQPSPTCPRECAGKGSFCHNNRLPACPSETSYKGPMENQIKNIKCAHVCIPVPKKICSIDIKSCPPVIYTGFRNMLIEGVPSPRGDSCLINKDQIRNPIGDYYWKFNAKCGQVIKRQ